MLNDLQVNFISFTFRTKTEREYILIDESNFSGDKIRDQNSVMNVISVGSTESTSSCKYGQSSQDCQSSACIESLAVHAFDHASKT